jgi:glycosyltransferase involved in cell wall biosynthesis
LQENGYEGCFLQGMWALKKPWRIAQVAPLHESVPPRLYGGTERVVSYLTEELVRQGHCVTLFASGDSVTSAELIAVCDRAGRLDPRRPSASALHTLMIEEVSKRAASFDIIHCHTESLHLPMARRCPVPVITTLHGRLDVPGFYGLHREFAELPLVSISHAQREPLPWANWVATVHHGLPLELHVPNYERGRYLAFLGRISPEKRVDRAIAIARRSGIPLKIAAKVDDADREYFVTRIVPLITPPLIEFVGEINEGEKTALLGGALALLFPIDWPEPFGLALIEAMACGTPVIAFRCGSVPEVVDPGLTGFIVTSVDEAVHCVAQAGQLDRHRCRQVFEYRFSAVRMARDYCDVYALCGESRCQLRA